MSQTWNIGFKISQYVFRRYVPDKKTDRLQKKGIPPPSLDYYFIFIDKFYKFTMEFRKKVAVGRQGTHQVPSMYVDGDPFAMVYQNKNFFVFYWV